METTRTADIAPQTQHKPQVNLETRREGESSLHGPDHRPNLSQSQVVVEDIMKLPKEEIMARFMEVRKCGEDLTPNNTVRILKKELRDEILEQNHVAFLMELISPLRLTIVEEFKVWATIGVFCEDPELRQMFKDRDILDKARELVYKSTTTSEMLYFVATVTRFFTVKECGGLNRELAREMIERYKLDFDKKKERDWFYPVTRQLLTSETCEDAHDVIVGMSSLHLEKNIEHWCFVFRHLAELKKKDRLPHLDPRHYQHLFNSMAHFFGRPDFEPDYYTDMLMRILQQDSDLEKQFIKFDEDGKILGNYVMKLGEYTKAVDAVCEMALRHKNPEYFIRTGLVEDLINRLRPSPGTVKLYGYPSSETQGSLELRYQTLQHLKKIIVADQTGKIRAHAKSLGFCLGSYSSI